MEYKQKYLKYKDKYLSLKKDIYMQGGTIKEIVNQTGGACKDGCKMKIITCKLCNFMKYCSDECLKADLVLHAPFCKRHKKTFEILKTKLAEDKKEYKLRKDAYAMSADETRIRTLAAEAIISFYKILNEKFDYAKERNRPAYETNYPGWNRLPLDPFCRMKIYLDKFTNEKEKEEIVHTYANMRLKPIPLFSTDLDLSFSTIPAGRTLNLDCTNAFYMTQYAILNKILPRYTRNLLDISVLDQLRSASPPSNFLLKGYNRDIELELLRQYKSMGDLTRANYIGINNVLLDEKKAQRMHLVTKSLQNFFKYDADYINIKLGDGCAIKNHPMYESSWGSYANEHVYCVGHNEEGVPLFIGFSGNGTQTDDMTNICIPQTITHIRKVLVRETIKEAEKRVKRDTPMRIDQKEALALELLLDVVNQPIIKLGSLITIKFNEDAQLASLPKPGEVSRADIDNQQSTISHAEIIAILGF